MSVNAHLQKVVCERQSGNGGQILTATLELTFYVASEDEVGLVANILHSPTVEDLFCHMGHKPDSCAECVTDAIARQKQ